MNTELCLNHHIANYYLIWHGIIFASQKKFINSLDYRQWNYFCITKKISTHWIIELFLPRKKKSSFIGSWMLWYGTKKEYFVGSRWVILHHKRKASFCCIIESSKFIILDFMEALGTAKRGCTGAGCLKLMTGWCADKTAHNCSTVKINWKLFKQFC